jgi:hypothetical protein
MAKKASGLNVIMLRSAMIVALLLGTPAAAQVPNGTPAPSAGPNIYRVGAGTSEYVQAQGQCIVVTNNAGADIPVFAGSAAEIQALAAHAPPGIAISACSFAVAGACGGTQNTCTAGTASGLSLNPTTSIYTWSCSGAPAASCSLGEAQFCGNQPTAGNEHSCGWNSHPWPPNTNPNNGPQTCIYLTNNAPCP